MLYSEHVHETVPGSTRLFITPYRRYGKVTNDHIMTRVDIERNVFLVDVGCGYPTFEAVPVNFEEEFVVYKQSFLEYKFVKSKETTAIVIKRFHRTSKTWKELFKRTIKMDQDGWWQFYHVDLTPRNLDFFLVK